MRLHRLLAQKEAHADLTIHEPVRDQLEDLDLPHRGLLLELAERPVERNDLAVPALPLGSDRFEAALMIHIAAEDLLALGGIHACPIGRMARPL